MPLLEPDDVNVDDETRNDLISSKSIEKVKNVEKTNSSTKVKNSPYNGPNDVSEEFCFRTERKPWSKIIEFAPVDICNPRNNSVEIRDTFKTYVTVRIVYLKVSWLFGKYPPQKQLFL